MGSKVILKEHVYSSICYKKRNICPWLIIFFHLPFESYKKAHLLVGIWLLHFLQKWRKQEDLWMVLINMAGEQVIDNLMSWLLVLEVSFWDVQYIMLGIILIDIYPWIIVFPRVSVDWAALYILIPINRLDLGFGTRVVMCPYVLAVDL